MGRGRRERELRERAGKGRVRRERELSERAGRAGEEGRGKGNGAQGKGKK